MRDYSLAGAQLREQGPPPQPCRVPPGSLGVSVGLSPSSDTRPSPQCRVGLCFTGDTRLSRHLGVLSPTPVPGGSREEGGLAQQAQLQWLVFGGVQGTP